MNYRITFTLATAFLLTACQAAMAGNTGDTVLKKKKLIWSEEFNYTGLPDSSKWSCETGGDGWGNNELQNYTAWDSSTAYVSNGTLKITVNKIKTGNNDYRSARLVTKGKAEFTYGRIEISAKLAKGRGVWPAIWMLGSNAAATGWPACGEIDIMEHVGFEKDTILGTVHTGAYNHVMGTHKGKKTFISDPYNSFHLYGIEWDKDHIDFMLDGKSFFKFDNEHKTNAEWPFDNPFFLILNIAVGGNLGGQKGVDPSIFPTSMEIDYIRVYN
jgi:beta-glucanase (GH16 family)